MQSHPVLKKILFIPSILCSLSNLIFLGRAERRWKENPFLKGKIFFFFIDQKKKEKKSETEGTLNI